MNEKIDFSVPWCQIVSTMLKTTLVYNASRSLSNQLRNRYNALRMRTTGVIKCISYLTEASTEYLVKDKAELDRSRKGHRLEAAGLPSVHGSVWRGGESQR